MGVVAVEDRHVFEIKALFVELEHLFGDMTGLDLRGRHRHLERLLATAAVGSQGFLELACVVNDRGVGELENRRYGSVIRLELKTWQSGWRSGKPRMLSKSAPRNA